MRLGRPAAGGSIEFDSLSTSGCATVSAVAAGLGCSAFGTAGGNVTQLIVEGKPFLALAGELYNNSATSLEYMKPVWPRLTAMHLNTVLAPISWALLEPAEGKFDYTLVDGLIRAARAQNLRLVLLWFGSWKNTWSSYAPDWVKRDFERFPRVQLRNGSGTERLTPLNTANRDADARSLCGADAADPRGRWRRSYRDHGPVGKRSRSHPGRARSLTRGECGLRSARPWRVDGILAAPQGDARSRSARQMASRGFQDRELGSRLRTWSGNRGPVHGVALRAVYRQGCGSGQGRIRPAHVRQCCSDPSQLCSRAIQQRRSAAPLHGHLGRLRRRNWTSSHPTSTSSSRNGARSTTARGIRCSSPKRPATPRARPTCSTPWGNTTLRFFAVRHRWAEGACRGQSACPQL